MAMLRLSAQHGVNPMLPICFYCCGDTGEVALLGHLPGDARAPHRGVINKEPCSKCKEWMEKGIILISVNEEKSKGDLENPYRTGGWTVVTEDFIQRVIQPPELMEHILKARVAFVPDDAWNLIGLPRETEKKR